MSTHGSTIAPHFTSSALIEPVASPSAADNGVTAASIRTAAGTVALDWGELTAALYGSSASDNLLAASDISVAEIKHFAGKGVRALGLPEVRRQGDELNREAENAREIDGPGQFCPSPREVSARRLAAKLALPPSATALSARVRVG